MYTPAHFSEKLKVIRTVYDLIQHHLRRLKDPRNEFKQPMLIYYQLCNLIQVYTQILKYILCF
jgi:hypothetical protein